MLGLQMTKGKNLVCMAIWYDELYKAGFLDVCIVFKKDQKFPIIIVQLLFQYYKMMCVSYVKLGKHKTIKRKQ
jgi:hypothetical protein